MVVIGLVLVTVGILARRNRSAASSAPPLIGQHWHVAYAFNICGEFKEPFRAFINPEGIHSHDVAGEDRGDGFVHVHPEIVSGQGENAKLAVFLEGAKAEVSANRIKLPGGVDVSDGERCKRLDDRESRVRWSVDGKERKGDPSQYRPKDGEVLAIAFLPDGVDIGKPPVAERGDTPADLPGATSSTTSTSSSTTSTAPAETTTSGSSTTTRPTATTSRPTTSTTQATTTTTAPAPTTTTTTTEATTTSSTPTTTTP